MFDDAPLITAAPQSVTATSMPSALEANMRRLRAVVEVAQCNSVHRAAERLHVTQSAVTRAVRALEADLGLTLFDRGPRGMATTEYGEILVHRTQRALGYLDAVEADLARHSQSHAPRGGRKLAAKVAQRHLQTVRAVADFRTETAAAQQLGISQPAITLALRDLEALLDTQMFQRTPKGMVPTPEGEIMIRGAKLALNEIEAAGADLAARLGHVRGRLAVGVLPLSGTQIAPEAGGREPGGTAVSPVEAVGH
ncbi:MAG TPA: LysR family transcriptional regulator [Burkholderiaceae bacterium]|nr:LysR family transcriptional regulator [Burkholderiaceae bacterium]